MGVLGYHWTLYVPLLLSVYRIWLRSLPATATLPSNFILVDEQYDGRYISVKRVGGALIP